MIIRQPPADGFSPLSSGLLVRDPPVPLRSAGMERHGMGRLPCWCCVCKPCLGEFPLEITVSLGMPDTVCCRNVTGDYVTEFVEVISIPHGRQAHWRWGPMGFSTARCCLGQLDIFNFCSGEFDTPMGPSPAIWRVSVTPSIWRNSGDPGPIPTTNWTQTGPGPFDCLNFVDFAMIPYSNSPWGFLGACSPGCENNAGSTCLLNS